MDYRMAPLARPRPALFLDRDGVIVQDTGYLSDPDGVAIIRAAATLVRRANELDIPVLVITNQSGIDRGLLDWTGFAAVEKKIADGLAKFGARSDATAACPFHPDHTKGYNHQKAQWRKPGPRLIEAVANNLNISLQGSWIIGDRKRDILAGRNAGLTGGILIGRQSIDMSENDLQRHAPGPFVIRTAETVSIAMDQIMRTDLFAPR